MKKVTLLFVVALLLGVTPAVASASFLSTVVNWIVPAEIKPIPTPIALKATGGTLVTADPQVLSGDTSRTYFLPAGSSRTFTIANQGAVQLFLNTSASLKYRAFPSTALGDVPGSFALNKGEDRKITITNPTTDTNVSLSKIDLGTVSSEAVVVQPQVFVSDAKSTAVLANGKENSNIAELSFNFVLNNATNKDIYIDRRIDPLQFAKPAQVPGADVSIRFIDSPVTRQAGDSANAYVIPAGSHRPFELTGIITNSKNASGQKTVALQSISYSYDPSLSDPQYITDPATLRGLTTSPIAFNIPAPIQKPILTLTPSVPLPSVSVAPSLPPEIPTASPIITATPQPTDNGWEIKTVSDLLITDGGTKFGPAIVENGQTVGYPVTFTFTAEAPEKTVYISKNPTLAFAVQTFGFGSIVPSIANISAVPALVKNDGANYFIMTPGAPRTFVASAIMRNDGVTGNASRILQILKIYYGTKSNNLREEFTVQNVSNLRAIVQLAPTITPKPTIFISPSTTPKPSTTVSPSPSPSPTDIGLAGICYATPPNPLIGDVVYWQVVDSGATTSITYAWSGTDGILSTTNIAATKYASSGKKDAKVEISSGGKKIFVTCSVTVGLPTPSVNPTPQNTVYQNFPSSSPSSQPSGSGSGSPSAFNPNRDHGMVASVLAGIGEFLDSLFGK